MSQEPVTSPTARKRSHDGTIVTTTSPKTTDTRKVNHQLPTPSSGTPSVNDLPTGSRHCSPALSSTGSSLTELTDQTGNTGHLPAQPGDSAGVQAPTKKRKLAFAEREVERALRQQEKEAKEKQKEQERQRKEDEKRAKDEEKRKKEEVKEAAKRDKELEKAEKQKVKDAEKAKKDEEKRKKGEEKLRKERSQMRLGNFFSKTTAPSTPPTGTPDDVSSGISSRRSSIASIDVDMVDASPLTRLRRDNPEYGTIFPPFFVHPHVEVAPANRLAPQITSEPAFVKDWHMGATNSFEPRLGLCFQLSSRPKKPHQERRKSLKEILAKIDGTSSQPVDLTCEAGPRIEDLTKGIPIKVFLFSEDVRPGYQGTYTRAVSPRTTRKLLRNPTARALPDTDYDNDSEAEWEAPAEGDEEVDLEEIESASEDNEEEMEDFLDDKDDVGKRKMIVGDLQPHSSGLCWQDEERSWSKTFRMHDFCMETVGNHAFPIDPYSIAYWVQHQASLPSVNQRPVSPSPAGSMQPPRLPLHASNGNLLGPQTLLEPTSHSENSPAAAKSLAIQSNKTGTSAKPKKTVPSDLLPAFKQAISGSDMNKVALTEILKKQFPKVSKDVIKATLDVVASRQGLKEADKRWVLNDGA